MFKLIFMGILIYYAYRMFAPFGRLEDRHYDDDSFEANDNSSNQDGEYIDYEEVD